MPTSRHPSALASAATLALLVTGLCPVAAHAEEAFRLDPDTRILPAIQFQKLTIFPVVQVASAAVDKSQYLTLADGLKQKLVHVSEQGSGGEVNRVRVKNASQKPLLLLAGETILGGQQDRILGKDSIVPAGEELSLEVYCVEHGRWSGNRQFTSTGRIADAEVRGKAKFMSNQGEVWKEVSKKNAGLGVRNQTDTYRNLAAGAEGEKAIQPYKDHVSAALAKLPEKERLVGVISAINGRVTSVDVFATPALFAAYRERLLDGIYLSAAAAPTSATPVVAPAPAAISDFVNKAEAAPEEEILNVKGASTKQKKAGNLGRSVVEDKSDAKAPPKPVYKSYQTF